MSAATDPKNPDLSLLAEIYQNLLLDNHLVALMESRIYRVLRSNFVLINDKGEEVLEAKKLLEKPWFETFVRKTVDSLFLGVQVMEVFDIDPTTGELFKTTPIPMAHINAKKGIILKRIGDETGWDYKNGNLERFYIQIGENGDLGMLADIAPIVLAKKQCMGAWMDFIEKFGIPTRSITTNNQTEARARELLDVLMNSINSQVMVLKEGETLQIGETPDTDAYKVFDQMILRINSEMAKRILGQDGTTDNKDATGTYGSLKVLQDVANDRHESDKLFVQYLINKQLLPRLVKLSPFYSDLENLTFDWDETQELPKEVMIDKAVALQGAGFEIDHEILAQKTGMPIIGKTATGSDPSKINAQKTQTDFF